MSIIPIIYQNNNLEILTKLLNSVARKYGCHVEYIAKDRRLQFFGDRACCRQISEETLALFRRSSSQTKLPLQCPVD